LGTTIVAVAKTKLIGLLAYAHGVMDFAAPSRLLYRDPANIVHLSVPIATDSYRDGTGRDGMAKNKSLGLFKLIEQQ
jgi:hypothetical protein